MSLIKRLMKQSLAASAYYSGMLYLFTFGKRAQRQREIPVILMYHRVLSAGEMQSAYTQPSIAVTVETFDRQMALLARKYNPMPLQDIVRLLSEGQPIPPHTVAVTFDDGWRDNYTSAFPILKRHKIPATIFLPTDFIGTGKLFWFLKAGMLTSRQSFTAEQFRTAVQQATGEAASLPANLSTDRDGFVEVLKEFDAATIERIIASLADECGVSFDANTAERLMLNWDEVREMNADLVDFGSHGKGHQILTHMRENDVVAELAASKAIIEKELGGPITLFSYPNGDYTDAMLPLVKQAGYAAATTTNERGPVAEEYRLYAIPRTGVHEGMAAGVNGQFSSAVFSCYLEQMF